VTARRVRRSSRAPDDPARFEHDGRVLLVWERGVVGGPVFVLVHGIGVARHYFAQLVPVLASRGTVLTVELPGFGSAPKPVPRRVQRIEDHADLLAAYLRSRAERAAVLVGHSMGTQIVVDLAVRHPGLAGRVVLIGPVTDPEAATPWQQGGRLVLDMLGESPGANVAVLTDYAKTGPRWYLATLPIMLGYDLPAMLPRVQVPALVVRGSRDPIARRGWTRRVADLLPRSRLVEIPGAHHVAMYTHPAAVAAEIERGVPAEEPR
jgi:pimeloyl-ACP methyl ester carboxylesterase